MSTKYSTSDASMFERTTSQTVQDTTMASTDTSKKEDSDATVETSKQSPDVEPVVEYPGNMQLVFIMLSVLLVLFLAALDQTIVATAIPHITDEFHGLNKVTWYGSAYFMTFAGFLPSWAKAVQEFSIKYAFLMSVFLFELGSIICAVSPTANVLIGGRAVAGLGCAGASTGAFMAISFAASPQRRPTLMGILLTTYALAAVLGPLIGGAFTGSSAGWRWCFWINLPVGGVAALLIFFSFHVPQPQTANRSKSLFEKIHQLDLFGAVLFMGALTAFIMAMQYGGQTLTWRNATVIGLLVGSAAIAVVFGLWEAWQGERSLIVLRVLVGRRAVWASALFQLFYAGTYFVVLYYLPIYFQSVDNTSPIGSGVHNLPLVVAMGLTSIILGVVISHLGRVGPFMTLGAALGAVSCGLFYTLGEHSSTGAWIGFQIIAGLAWGGPFQCAIMGAQAGQPLADLTLVSSIVLLCQTLGGTFGISAAQCAFNNTLLKTVARLAPDIDSSLVLSTGATEIRYVFSAAEVPIVVHAYVDSLRVVWALAVTMCGISFLLSFLCRWSRLFPKGVPAEPTATV